MLLMIRTQATIVRTTPANPGVVDVRLFRRLKKDLSTPSVVIDIIGDQHALCSMLGTALEHQHFIVLKDDLAFDFAEALRAERDNNVIEKIWTAAAAHAVLRINNVRSRPKIEKTVGRHHAMPASAAHCKASSPTMRGESFKNSKNNRAAK